MNKKMIIGALLVGSFFLFGCGGGDGGGGAVSSVAISGDGGTAQVSEIAKMMENSGIVMEGDENKYYEKLEQAINDRFGGSNGPDRAAVAGGASVLSKVTLSMAAYEIMLSPSEKTTFNIDEKISVKAAYAGKSATANDITKCPELKWSIYSGGGSLNGKIYTPAAAAGTAVLMASFTENRVTKFALFRLKVVGLSKVTLGKASDRIEGSSIEVSVFDLSNIAVTAAYSNGASRRAECGKDLVWSLVSGKGKLEGSAYKAPQTAETATFKATCAEGGISKFATFKLSVLKPILPTFAISLSKSVDMIQAGGTYDLSKIAVKADFSIGTSGDVTQSPNLTWVKTSGRGKLDGKCYAATPVAETAVFTATYKEYGTAKTAQLRLTVNGSAVPNTTAAFSVDLGDGVAIEMMKIPAGSFTMGGGSSLPAHKVNVTNDYYIGKYEITQEQWEKVMGANPSFNKKGEGYPAEHLSWEECQEFVSRLNAKGTGNFRMPTEAEWEYACRAGSTGTFYWGSSINGDYCWYSGNAKNEAQPVGQKLPNAFGLFDMSGNVAEWCSDYYDANYYKASPANDPAGPASGSLRVMRSGGTGNLASAAECASSFRCGFNQNGKPNHTGFRLAMGATNAMRKVEAPVFTPASGVYTSAITVSIKCATEGATIRYTTDGSIPSVANGLVYTSAFTVSKTATVKAIATKDGMKDSDAASATYTIKVAQTATPLFKAEYFFDMKAWDDYPFKVNYVKFIASEWKWSSPFGIGFPGYWVDGHFTMDDFSVRYTGNFPFKEGTYKFFISGDDYAWFYIDGKLVDSVGFYETPDTWVTPDGVRRPGKIIEVKMTEGVHFLQFQMYEHMGAARAILDWKLIQ